MSRTGAASGLERGVSRLSGAVHPVGNGTSSGIASIAVPHDGDREADIHFPQANDKKLSARTVSCPLAPP